MKTLAPSCPSARAHLHPLLLQPGEGRIQKNFPPLPSLPLLPSVKSHFFAPIFLPQLRQEERKFFCLPPIRINPCASVVALNQKSQIKNQKLRGWFVPDARWLELREALAEKIESLEKR